MNLSKLYQLRIDEKRIDVPQRLPESFYDAAQNDLDALRGQAPESPNSSRIEHQIEAYETELSLLHERRVRKLIWMAGPATNGQSVESRNLTPREEEFLEGIKVSIEAEQDRLFGEMPDLDC